MKQLEGPTNQIKAVQTIHAGQKRGLHSSEWESTMNQTPIMRSLTPRYSIALALSLALACDPFDTRREHPIDAKLIRAFQKNEATFRTLVQMSNEDSNVSRIAYDFTRLETNWNWPRTDSQLGFSKKRWDQYRALFSKLNLPSGLYRGTNAELAVVFLAASSKGMTLRGSSKGYAFCEHPLSPLHDSLDQHPFDPRNPEKHGVAFRRIKEHWYLFYDW